MDGGTKRDFRITLSLPVDSGMRRTSAPRRGNASTRVPSNSRHAPLTLQPTDDVLESGQQQQQQQQQQQDVVIDVKNDVASEENHDDNVLKLADKKGRLSRHMFLLLFWIGLISIVVAIHIAQQRRAIQPRRSAAMFDSTTAVGVIVNVTLERAASVVHFDACCRSLTQLICGVQCTIVVLDNTAMCKLPANAGPVNCVFYYSE